MTPRLLTAQAKVTDTRAALIETARQLQQRLAPKTLAREAWESAKVKGADLAEDAVDAVKRRPVATGGIIAALTMFLAREPIKYGASKIYEAMTSDKPAKALAAKRLASSARRSSPKPATKAKTAPRPRRKTEKPS